MANGSTILVFGMGICLGAAIVYAITLANQRPYRYEIERDESGRCVAIGYLPMR